MAGRSVSVSWLIPITLLTTSRVEMMLSLTSEHWEGRGREEEKGEGKGREEEKGEGKVRGKGEGKGREEGGEGE